jgi:glutamate racemase
MRLGVFDSGIGGITVLRELRSVFPAVSYVYLGDTAHVPYGTKSQQQIERFSIECASRLREKQLDALVVACNTASSLALGTIRETMAPIPVFGVVEPGVTAVMEMLGSSNDGQPVLVLATPATIRSRAYGRLLREKIGSSQAGIIEQACPLLVPMIEEGWIDHPILHLTLAEYLAGHVRAHLACPGIALLGCTHYPWIQAAFERALPGWKVINSAQAVTAAVARALPAIPRRGPPGPLEWIFTDPYSVPSFARNVIETDPSLRKADT